jgi:hypothetical protein
MGLGKERRPLDEGGPGSRVAARSSLKRWNTRGKWERGTGREPNASRDFTVIEAIQRMGKEGGLICDD